MAEGENQPLSFSSSQVSGAVALTITSWTGLYNHFNNKERTVVFETFLKFLGAFRQLNNFKMRILVGGLYNVDLKVTQFWRFPELVPLVYTNRPNPNERRELQCSFIYTKDTLKVKFSEHRLMMLFSPR